MDRVCKLTGARHDVNEIAASSDQLSNSLFPRFPGYFVILPFRWSGILLELTLARAQISSSRACVLYCHGNLRVLGVRCHGVDSTVFGTISIEPKCRLRRISSIPMRTMEQWDKGCPYSNPEQSSRIEAVRTCCSIQSLFHQLRMPKERCGQRSILHLAIVRTQPCWLGLSIDPLRCQDRRCV
jgi:hypothetical protein